MKKIRVAVLYGGRSGEHEVSLQSAASVINFLDRDRCEIDVVFPVMHGPLCEDGTIQGLLELADLPYVGCGVLASAVSMDKEITKRLARDAGIPVVPYISLKHDLWKKEKAQSAKRIEEQLNYPVFIKPANLGSSVGVHKVKDPGSLEKALEDAFNYDRKVLVEAAVNAREIEVSVLENLEPGEDPLVSVPGEIDPTHEFYSYEAKYLDENGAALIIPANLTPEETKAAQEIAKKIFVLLECEGMARVDLFLDRTTEQFFLNELNTIPGFTSISMYPKLWEASGINYPELLTRLIDLAIARHAAKKKLLREFRK